MIRIVVAAVTVLGFVSDGTTAQQAPPRSWTIPGVPGVPRTWRERFMGSSVAVGDVNGDGLEDIALGAPAEWGGYDEIWAGEGALYVVDGYTRSLIARRVVHEDVPDERRKFGHGVGIGDFDGDGYGDVAAAYEDWRLDHPHPRIRIFYGPDLERFRDVQEDEQDSGEHPDKVGIGTHNVIAMDYDRDGIDDLVTMAGLPHEAIHVFRGPDFELVQAIAVGHLDSYQNVFEVADFNGDGHWDMAVSAPLYDRVGFVNAGAVWVLWGPDYDEPQLLLEDTPDGGAKFGDVLSTGDMDGDGLPDLIAVSHKERCEIDFRCSEIWVFSGPRLETRRVIADFVETAQGASAQIGQSPVLADIDGDGFKDFVTGLTVYPEGRLADAGIGILRGPEFEPPWEVLPVYDPSYWRTVGSEDIEVLDRNGDGRDDLILGQPYLARDAATNLGRGLLLDFASRDRTYEFGWSSPSVPTVTVRVEPMSSDVSAFEAVVEARRSTTGGSAAGFLVGSIFEALFPLEERRGRGPRQVPTLFLDVTRVFLFRPFALGPGDEEFRTRFTIPPGVLDLSDSAFLQAFVLPADGGPVAHSRPIGLRLQPD